MTARCDDAVLTAAERLTRDPLTRERLTDVLEFVRDAEMHPGTSLRAGYPPGAPRTGRRADDRHDAAASS
jgi:hypothetical protein